jgi:hypothetical protein
MHRAQGKTFLQKANVYYAIQCSLYCKGMALPAAVVRMCCLLPLVLARRLFGLSPCDEYDSLHFLPDRVVKIPFGFSPRRALQFRRRRHCVTTTQR